MCNQDGESDMQQTLNGLQREEEDHQPCDVVIHVGGETFRARKDILAASSSYFKAMFTSGFKESSEREIKLEGRGEIFRVILQFAYTGKLETTPGNLYEVLSMACYLQYIDAICDSYETMHKLQCYFDLDKSNQQVSTVDALKILELAKNHDNLLWDLGEQLLNEYVEQNVQGLKDSDEFLQKFGVTYLEELLNKEGLPDETQVSLWSIHTFCGDCTCFVFAFRIHMFVCLFDCLQGFEIHGSVTPRKKKKKKTPTAEKKKKNMRNKNSLKMLILVLEYG